MKITDKLFGFTSTAVALSAILLPGAGRCEYTTVTVANAYRQFFHDNTAFRADTVKQAEYPAEIGTPMIWIDASDTEGWTVDEATKIVSKAVNKGTSQRYLTADHNEIQSQNYATAEGKYPLWYGSLNVITGPELKPADGKINGPYLDFGEVGSKKGLWFNAISAVEGASLSNRLTGIGSVIGVYKSNKGGGQLLGGERWRRYANGKDRGTNRTDTIVRYGVPTAAMYNGTFWHGQQRHALETSYWPRDWAVLALNPTEASLYAEGVGCGYCEGVDASSSSGGQAIAELLIFDKALTDDESAKVVAYLEHKWLKPAAGWNGNAQVSWINFGGAASGTGDNMFYTPMPGVKVPVEVGSGEKLTIGRLNGGRSVPGYPHRLEKTGDGTLCIGDGRQFGGVIDVKEGVLEVGGKAIPTFEDLPGGAAVHFDASNLDSVTFDGDGLVSAVTNLGENLCAVVQNNTTLMPKLVQDVPAQGLNLLDFGPRTQSEGKGMEFSSAQYVATVVAVVDARIAAGGHLFDQMFCRPVDWISNYVDYRTVPVLGNSSIGINNHTSLNPRTAKSKVWVNGLEIAYTECYESPGLLVVAYRVPACYVRVFGARAMTNTNCGGIRIGEVIAWRETLSDEEIRDVQAYLAKKWLDRTLSGYASDDGVPDLQSVNCMAGSVINVPAGRTAVIGSLSSEGSFRKTGAGTLKVLDASGSLYDISVEEGKVNVHSGPAVGGKCVAAPEAALHIDPSDLNFVKTFELNGTNFIWSVQDRYGKGGGRVANTDVTYTHPWLVTDPAKCCNGRSVIDFGEQAEEWNNTEGASLPLSVSVKNVRAVYFVYNSDAGGGQPLGWLGGQTLDATLCVGSEGTKRLDFYRASPIVTGQTPLFNSSCSAVTSGELFINGVKQNTVKSYIPNGGWDLVELHTTAGAQFNGFGNAFQAYCHGGFRLGEVIVYERPLTDRERIATRNYLLKKWFEKTDDELEDLPEATVADQIVMMDDISVAEGDALVMDGGVKAQAVTGEGTVVCTGTMSVSDVSAFSGAFSVSEGAELKLTGEAPAAEPAFVEDGRILHLDATDGIETETNDVSRVISVKKWNSILNDGWSAMPGPAYNSWTTTNYPSVLRKDLSGNDIVSIETEKFFLFCKDGVTKRLENIQSAFWVIGSQEGGGFLLGGGAGDMIGWHRGGSKHGIGAANAGDGLFHGASLDAVEYGTWRLNGRKLESPARNTGLSGGYDVLSFVMNQSYNQVPNADGLALDGRFMADLKNMSARRGHQRLGELVIYGRKLSDEEVAGMEAYLRRKWGFARNAEVNAATVELSSGATLNCVNPQYVDTLGGSGDVEGDVTVKNLVADWNADGISVSGTLSVAENATIELRNLPESIENGSEIVIVRSAGEILGAENLQNAVIVGESPARKLKIKVKVVDGKVSVKFMPEGFWMILR